MIVVLLAFGWFVCTAAGSIAFVLLPPLGAVLLIAGAFVGTAAVDASVREPGGGYR